MALGTLRPGLVYCPGDWMLQLASMNDFHFSQQRWSGGPATQPPDGQRGPIGSMCELAKGIVTVARIAPSSQSGESGEKIHAAMRLARKSSSQAATLRRTRSESLPGAFRIRL